MNKRERNLKELAKVMATLPAGSMIEPRYMQACEPNFIIGLLDRLEAQQDAIYDLQMSDPHLEFISRVQDAGMHHDWDEFMATLTMLEGQLDGMPTLQEALENPK